MTSSEFAASQGFSPAYVTKLVQQGIIRRSADGQIDPQQAVAAINARRDPARPLRRGRPVEQANEGDAQLAILMLKSRIKTEVERGKKAELDRREREAELIDAAEVKAEQLRRATQEREALLNWPNRIASAMAAELRIEERQVLHVLRKYVRQHLTERSSQSSETSNEGA